jgi:hypothetical protein
MAYAANRNLKDSDLWISEAEHCSPGNPTGNTHLLLPKPIFKSKMAVSVHSILPGLKIRFNLLSKQQSQYTAPSFPSGYL